MPIRLIVVGARSARQGTGPFIAGAFHRLGAEVCAIVGTRSDTVDRACESLAREQGIHCTGYLDLFTALIAQEPDVVAICSPYAFHREQLALVGAQGCHCLVEKPLAWPAQVEEITNLIGAFRQKDLLLQLVTQWPESLPAFTGLHGARPQTVTDFSMGLSPISIGRNMVPDSAPHFISMLQALLGPGDFSEVEVNLGESTPGEITRLTLDCIYQHGAGNTRARLILETCAQRPRPAWYQINNLRVDRAVSLPEYSQELVAGENRVQLSDPIEAVVANFLNRIADQRPTDFDLLLAGHRNLIQLDRAWPEER